MHRIGVMSHTYHGQAMRKEIKLTSKSHFPNQHFSVILQKENCKKQINLLEKQKDIQTRKSMLKIYLKQLKMY